MSPQNIIQAAFHIRGILQTTFPERPDLAKQCKRFAILFDLYARHQGVSSYPVAGWIIRPDDLPDRNRGHVWTLVPQPDHLMVLDGTLTQFATYLEQPIPPIVWLPWSEAKRRYAYQSVGAYHYTRNDIRSDLVEQITRLAQRHVSL